MKQHRLGHYIRIKDKHDPRDIGYKAEAPIDIPDVVDLRPNCSPVENQGELGSCTGHACVAALEYAQNVEREQPIRLSRLFVYYNERDLEGTIRQDSGGQIRDVIKSVAKYGACDETLWPYDEAAFKRRPSTEAYDDAKKHVAIEYRRVSQKLDDLLHALAAGFPIVFGIYVYESFEGDEAARTGMIPIPTHEEKCVGGHAILIVGYDKIRQLFIIRNSWGEEWGEKGYCYLPFDYVMSPDLSEDFWSITKVS